MLILLIYSIWLTAPRQSEPLKPGDLGGEPSVEAEVFQNVVNQPLGTETLKSLNLPDAFVERAADRVIRSTYQGRYHVVAAPPTEELRDPLISTTPKADLTEPPRNSEAAQTRRESTSKSRWPYWIAGLAVVAVVAAGLLTKSRGRATQTAERPGKTK